MPQRLTDVPALLGNDSSLFLFGLVWLKNIKILSLSLSLPPLSPPPNCHCLIYFVSILWALCSAEDPNSEIAFYCNLLSLLI